ncbi:MAG TPA: helix-turn-helix domain-containing protein, partial [Candidatus Latescibacteria bacterium]|nr:helix-turn-helix domain-containing protein [Candidatus Latescibacterota bacterium]
NLPDMVRDKVFANRLLPVASRGSGAEKMELGIIYRTLLELRADMADLKQILTAPGNGVASRSWSSASLPPQDASSPASKPHVVDIEVSEDDTPSGETTPARTLTLRDLERDAIRQALAATKGNRREAARSLGIGERTLYRKLREYNLS